jgi:hypothetical protein
MGNLTNLLLLFFTVPWLYELSLRNVTKRHVKLGLGFIVIGSEIPGGSVRQSEEGTAHVTGSWGG